MDILGDGAGVYGRGVTGVVGAGLPRGENVEFREEKGGRGRGGEREGGVRGIS